MIRSISLAVLLHVIRIYVSSNNIEGLVTGFTCAQIHAGDTAVIRFNSSISSTSGLLFIRITLGDGPDILDCFRNETQSHPVCTIYNPRFQSDGLVDDQLSLVLKNSTRDLQGVYVLRLAFNNTQYAVSCNLNLLGTTDDATQHDQDVSNLTMIAAVISIIVVVFCALGVFFMARKKIRNSQQQEHRQPENIPLKIDSAGTETLVDNTIEEVLLGNNTRFNKMSRGMQAKLLRHNEPGSYLIRRRCNDPHNYTLAVNCKGVLEYFPIKIHGDTFKLQAAGPTFTSLSELELHYTENYITSTKGKAYSKLTHRCTAVRVEG